MFFICVYGICPYCYAAGDYDYSGELTQEEIRSALKQAAELGARKIVILGGEPLLYPHLREMIRFIRSLDMGVEIFTNGSLMTRELAEFFFAENCRLVVKLNTLDKTLHDRLTGHRNSLELSQNALRLLRGAGYDSRPGMLCATTVLSSANLASDKEYHHDNNGYDDHKGYDTNSNPNFRSQRQALQVMSAKFIVRVVISNRDMLQSITSLENT